MLSCSDCLFFQAHLKEVTGSLIIAFLMKCDCGIRFPVIYFFILGASSPEPDVEIGDEGGESSVNSRCSSIRECAYHPTDHNSATTSGGVTSSNKLPPNFSGNEPPTNDYEIGHYWPFTAASNLVDNATASLAGIDAEQVLEASYVENCLLELSVSHTEDVRDYLENSQADVRTLVSHRKKPKKYQVRPSSLQAALQIQEDPKFQSAKKDQKAKLKSKTERKVNSKNALKRQNLQRLDVANKNKKSFALVKSRMINQCAARNACH